MNTRQCGNVSESNFVFQRNKPPLENSELILPAEISVYYIIRGFTRHSLSNFSVITLFAVYNFFSIGRKCRFESILALDGIMSMAKLTHTLPLPQRPWIAL